MSKRRRTDGTCGDDPVELPWTTIRVGERDFEDAAYLERGLILHLLHKRICQRLVELGERSARQQECLRQGPTRLTCCSTFMAS